MNYIDFVNEVSLFPASTRLRTNLGTLHSALNTLRMRSQLPAIRNIDKVKIVHNESVTSAINDLVSWTVDGYSNGISDQLMIGAVNIDMDASGAIPDDIDIDIILVHTVDIKKDDQYHALVAALTSSWVHGA